MQPFLTLFDVVTHSFPKLQGRISHQGLTGQP